MYAFYASTPVVVPNIYSSSDISGSTITIPAGTKYIGANAFEGLKGLTSIVIPTSVVGVTYGAFSGCINLKTVDLGSVKFLDYCSFSNCGITSLNIPNTTKYINTTAFTYDIYILTITVGGAGTYFKEVNNVLYSSDMKCLMVYPTAATSTAFTIPDTVTIISDELFSQAVCHCKQLI